MHERQMANMLHAFYACRVPSHIYKRVDEKDKKGEEKCMKCINQEINKKKIRSPIGGVSCFLNLKSRVQS